MTVSLAVRNGNKKKINEKQTCHTTLPSKSLDKFLAVEGKHVGSLLGAFKDNASKDIPESGFPTASEETGLCRRHVGSVLCHHQLPGTALGGHNTRQFLGEEKMLSKSPISAPQGLMADTTIRHSRVVRTWKNRCLHSRACGDSEAQASSLLAGPSSCSLRHLGWAATATANNSQRFP